jgi:hypothetical protein
MRFYITIPGFAMGEDGQQKATISVEIEEQYIAFIQEGEEDNYNPASAKPVTIKGKDEGAIQYTTGTPKGENIIEYTIEDINSYHINRPYYYIKQNGVPMPNYIWVYVTTKEWQEKINSGIATISFNDSTGNTEAYYYENGERISTQLTPYFTEALWSGGSRGRVYINYYGEEFKTTTMMDIDNQPYTFRFTSTPWVYGGYSDQESLYDPATNELYTIDAFIDGTGYGPEDIILMPTFASGAHRETFKVVYEDLDNPEDTYPEFNKALGHTFDEKYGFKVTFGPGQEEVFLNIRSGGTYYNNYGRWYFGDVLFGTGTTQYATLTLGGKGGQVVRWSFPNLTLRKWVNTNISDVIAVQDTYKMPDTFTQYFSGPNGYERGVEVPLTLRNFRTPMGNNFGLNEETKEGIMPGVLPAGISQNDSYATITAKLEQWYKSSERTLVKHKFTISTNQMTPKYSIAMVDWGIDQYCAYPETTDTIGGTIILAGYDSLYVDYTAEAEPPEWNVRQGVILNNFDYNSLVPQRYESSDNTVYLLHPDHAEAYPNAPLCVDGKWKYPAGMQDGGFNTGTMSMFYYRKGQYEEYQNAVPEIEVERGTRFEIHNLPVLQILYAYLDDGFLGINKTWHFVKGVTYMPWQYAFVWRMEANQPGWRHVDNIFSPNSNSYYGVQQGGFEYIDTNAPAGTVYTIMSSLNMSGANSVVVKIKLVNRVTY